VISELISNAITRRLAEEKILYMSFHDQLTGLYNRHYLAEEMQRLDTERQLPISIIMADLNGLKLINDTYGHSTGDEMLKRTAAILKEVCRKEDILARYGGDEFVVYLPCTREEDTQVISRRITRAFDEEQIKDVPITISIGMAAKTDAEQDITAVLRAAEDKMYKHKLTESSSGKSAVLNALLKTLAEKSYETEIHTRNMQEVAIKIGEKLGLPDSELHRLSLLITLHDIGKINIPEDLLTKKEALTANEWEIMKKHSETGYRIARATEEFAHVAEDILAHHEHWDGSGYPRGLKGDTIPLLARITAIADAYEVMSHGRPYKKAMSRSEILAESKNCSGTQFDPELVEIFLSVLEADG
jgi:diguanylate cyclase (GGDEF)-like protein